MFTWKVMEFPRFPFPFVRTFQVGQVPLKGIYSVIWEVLKSTSASQIRIFLTCVLIFNCVVMNVWNLID